MAAIFGAEHLSQGRLAGFYQALTIPVALQYLRAVSSKSSQIQTMINELSSAQELAKKFAVLSGETSRKIAERARDNLAQTIVKKIASLRVNEGFIIPCGYMPIGKNGHAVSLRIVCTGSDPAKYNAYLYNEGEGNENHPQETDKDGQLWYQSFICRVDITKDSLSTNFFNGLIDLFIPSESNDIHKLYDTFQKIGGNVAEKTDRISNPNGWTKGQLGGSCSAQSIMAPLRHMLPKEEYQRFKYDLRREFLFKIIRKINSRNCSPSVRKVSKELSKRISKYAKKHKLPEDKLPEKPTSTTSQITELPSVSKTSLQEEIKAAIKSNNENKITELRKLLCDNKEKLSDIINEEDYVKLVESLKNTPLTDGEIDLLVGIGHQLKRKIDEKTEQLFYRWKQLNLAKTFSETPWAIAHTERLKKEQLERKINECLKDDAKIAEERSKTQQFMLIEDLSSHLSEQERQIQKRADENDKSLRFDDRDTLETYNDSMLILKTARLNGYKALPDEYLESLYKQLETCELNEFHSILFNDLYVKLLNNDVLRKNLIPSLVDNKKMKSSQFA